MRGKGKTNYLKNRLFNVSPLFIVDIRNEYGHVPVFRNFNEFLSFAMNYLKGPQDFVRQKMQYRFAFASMQEYVKLFYLLSGVSNCTLVIDEADAIFSERKFSQPLTNIFLGSRNNNVSMIFVGKRPFLLPILIRSQADEYIIFGIEETRDIQYLENRIRKDFPVAPEQLKMGNFIVAKQGEKPVLFHVSKFSPNSQSSVSKVDATSSNEDVREKARA